MSYQKESPFTIQSLFNSIADQYDTTNGILSLGFHHIWNRTLRKKVVLNWQKEAVHHLDLCAGTGEITRLLLKSALKKKKNSSFHATLVDFSPGMLEVSKKRLSFSAPLFPPLSFIEADVEKLPLPDNSFDTITLSYGIRNVKTPLNALKEAYRVLKPHGKLFILELTRPKNKLLAPFHSFYLTYILPLLGSLATSNKEAYTYLSQSIENFVEPSSLNILIKEAGFKDASFSPITFGTATLFEASK